MISIDSAGYIEYWDPETGGFINNQFESFYRFPKGQKRDPN
jgi:hypothetical protein